MKILHTADWHVRQGAQRTSPARRHRAVLADLVRIADAEDVDLVVVAGDLFETSSPNPQAQSLVMRTLLRLRGDGRHVVFWPATTTTSACRRGLPTGAGELGLHVVGMPKSPANGGTLSLPMRTGETAKVAVLPFLAYRYAVRAAEIVLREASEHSMAYANQVGLIISALTAGSPTTPSTSSPPTPRCWAAGGAVANGRARRCWATNCRRRCSRPARITPRSGTCTVTSRSTARARSPTPARRSRWTREEANESVALIVHATPGSRAQVGRSR